MREAKDDVEGRMPIWRVLQEFYLDNTLTQADLEDMARAIAKSPYTMQELDQIMFNDMWPALVQNLMGPAGNWTGFKDEFLKERILKYGRPPGNFPWWIHPGKLLSFGRAWVHVKKRASDLRDTNRHASKEMNTP